MSNLKSIVARNPIAMFLGALLLVAAVIKLLPDTSPDNSEAAAGTKRSTASANSAEPYTASAMDASTRCPRAIEAFDGTDKQKVFSVDHYVQEVMREQDRIHVDGGERSLIASLNSRGFVQLRAMAIVYCRQSPSSLLHDAAAEAYDGARSLQDEFGTK